MKRTNNLAFSKHTKGDVPIKDILPTRMHRISQKFVTGSIRASRFSNAKSDTNMKRNIHNETTADYDMFTFSKKLLTKEVMTKVQRWYSRARDLMRIPADGKYDPMRYGVSAWNTGEVLIPIGRLHDLQAAFEECKAGLRNELTELEPQWAQYLLDAEMAAGDLFNADQMPRFADFANKWEMRLEICMLPEMDKRVELDNDELNDLVQQAANNTRDKLVEKLSKGWGEAARSLMQSLEYTAAVLGNDPATVQRLNGTSAERKTTRAVPIADTLFDNLTNQINTTRALAESTEDYPLMDMANKAASTLGGLRADYIRSNPAARQEATAIAKGLVREAKEVIQSTEAAVQGTLDELEAFV